MAQHTNPLRPDPVGARCLRWGLDFLDYVDRTVGNKDAENLFRGINFNCCPLVQLAQSYLLHYLFGPGAAPLSDEEAREKLSGTRLFEHAKFVACRTPEAMASFSWFDTRSRLMGVVTPLDVTTYAVPRYRSLIGFIEDVGTPDGKRKGPRGQDPIKMLARETELLPGGGFSVGLHLA